MSRSGEIRRVHSKKTGANFLVSARAGKQQLQEAADRYRKVEADSAIAARLGEKQGKMARGVSAGYPTLATKKPTIEEYTGGDKHFFYERVLPRLKLIEPKLRGVKRGAAYRIIEAARLPFHLTPQEAGWESEDALEKRAGNRGRIRAEYIERRREGRPLMVRPASEITASRFSRRMGARARRAKRIRRMVRRATGTPEGRERIARDTAKARVRAIEKLAKTGETIPVNGAEKILRAAPATFSREGRQASPAGS
jgi:hypothetical protein